MSPTGESAPAARPFFTPGTILAILGIVLCIGLIVARPLSGPEAASEPESTAILEIQAKMLVGMATADRPKAIEAARELESSATKPAGAKALAAFYLYLHDDALSADAKRLLEAAPDPSKSHRLLLRAVSGGPPWTNSEIQVLKEELGWFGELAEAASNDAARARVTSASQRILLVIGLGGLAIAVLFVVGMILLLVAIVERNRLVLRLQPAEFRGAIYLQGFALYLITMVGGGFIGGLAGGSVLLSVVLILISLLVGLIYPVLRGVPFGVMRQELGLHAGAGFGREVMAGVATYVACLPVMAIGLMLTTLLQMLVNGGHSNAQEISHPIIGVIDGADWRLIALLAGLAAVQGPITEEIMFRGALYGALRSRFGRIGSLLVMAFCFAVVHPQGLLAVPALMGIALAFGFMREWRGSLIAGIVTHGLHNAVLIAFAALALGK
jgi:membrane protease YdiL (CAAX protease family)